MIWPETIEILEKLPCKIIEINSHIWGYSKAEVLSQYVESSRYTGDNTTRKTNSSS